MYAELVKALRHCSHDGLVKCNECKYGGKEWPVGCEEEMMRDAAAAIEALNRLVELNTERCEGLREQLRKAHEQYEKHLNELEQQLPKRGEWIRVQEVDIPGEIHPAAFKCMCSVCRNEYLFPRIPRYCLDCGSINTAKTEVQDG